MTTIKLTTIRCEKRRTIILRNQVGTLQAFCAVCADNQPMLSANNAAQLLNLSERRIFTLVEAGEFHIFENDNGRLFICFASLRSMVGKLVLNETKI